MQVSAGQVFDAADPIPERVAVAVELPRRPERLDEDGKAVVAAMKATPTDDPLFGKGAVRKDGRVIHDMHLFEVKSPDQSKEPWDYYTHKRTVPAAEAFRPIDKGGCALALG